MDEKDPENDNDNMQIKEITDIEGKVIKMKYFGNQGGTFNIGHLVCLSVEPFQISVYEIRQKDALNFDVSEFFKTDPDLMKFESLESEIYSQFLND